VRCIVVQCVAVCYSALQKANLREKKCSELQCVVSLCSVKQGVAGCCSAVHKKTFEKASVDSLMSAGYSIYHSTNTILLLNLLLNALRNYRADCLEYVELHITYMSYMYVHCSAPCMTLMTYTDDVGTLPYIIYGTCTLQHTVHT